jgi:hypothetical protein
MRWIVVAVAVAILLLAEGAFALAQPEGAPTDCTESMTIGTIFIGHDCGEWASVVISGRVVMRKPWSRVNRASRAARLRARREAAAATAPPAAAPPAAPATLTLYGIDVSGGANPNDLDCDDFTYREEAEALWATQGWTATNDPHNLDGEATTVDDGQPCERLPTRRG